MAQQFWKERELNASISLNLVERTHGALALGVLVSLDDVGVLIADMFVASSILSPRRLTLSQCCS